MSLYLPHISEEDLIYRCRNRDHLAFSILYTRYKKALLHGIYRLIPEEEQANDIHQETFIKVWNSISSYDASKAKLYTWILSIARNLVIDRVRSKEYKQSTITHRLSEYDDPQQVTDMYCPVELNTDRIDLVSIMQKLEPRYITLLDLMYFQGYTHIEAAEELGIPVGTVKTQLRMAVSILRKEFQGKK